MTTPKDRHSLLKTQQDLLAQLAEKVAKGEQWTEGVDLSQLVTKEYLYVQLEARMVTKYEIAAWLLVCTIAINALWLLWVLKALK